jgi:hypothetical protein
VPNAIAVRDFIDSIDDLQEVVEDRARAQEVAALEKKMAAYFLKQGDMFNLVRLRRYFAESVGTDADALLLDVLKATEKEGAGILEVALVKGSKIGYELQAATFDISFKLSNPRAVAYAKKAAAEHITQINGTTKDVIHNMIVKGVEEGKSYGKVAREIKKRFHEFAVGKPQEHIASRAQLVAVTENAEAYESGGRLLVDDLEDAGLDMEKSWGGPGAEDPHTSEGCLENKGVGWIPAKRAFPSGHQHPPRFPGCRHHTLYRVARGEEVKPKAVKPKPIKPKTAEQWAENMTPQEQMAMKLWQHTAYPEIRAYERAGTIGSASTKDMVKLFHNTLNKAPHYKGTVYRGLYDLDDDVYRAIVKAGKKPMTFDASSSASLNRAIAEDFMNEGRRGHSILFEIKAKTGVDVNGASSIDFIHEQEIILRKGTQYRITSIKELGDVGEVPGVQWTKMILEEI